MRSNYSAFITRVIQKYEGGYGWDSADTGGPTKYGITCYDLAAHRGKRMTSMAAWAPIVKAMPLAEAEEIYKKKYATGVFFDLLPSGVDCVMLDYGINSGTSRPLAVARALLKVSSNAKIVDAVKKVDAKWFINAMCDERLHFMHAIRGGSAWKTFGRGWQARVDDLRKYCLAKASGTRPEPATDLSSVPTPKATNPVPSVVQDVTLGTGGSGATAAGAKASGVPWHVVIAIFVAGVTAAVIFAVLRKRRAEKANELVVIPSSVPPLVTAS